MVKEQLIFSVDNPAIAGHRVFGQFVLPGLAYIDIFCQFSRKLGLLPGAFELRHLTMHNLMSVEKEAKLVVAVQGEKSAPDCWKVRLEGRKLYATAEVRETTQELGCSALNIDLLKTSARRVYPISDVYLIYRNRGLWHEGFIRAEGDVYELADGLIFQGSVGREVRATAQGFLFHPALMDGCAVATMHLVDDLVTEKEGLFLPMYLESFFATAPINKYCVAYVSRGSVERKNEVISMSICFFDETGKRIGEMTNLSSKRVGGDPARSQPKQDEHEVTKSTDLVLHLKDLMGSHFGISPGAIDPRLDYYHLGFDSVSLLQLTEGIGTKMGVDLPPTLLFEYSTISALAEHLSAAYPDIMRSLNFL